MNADTTESVFSLQGSTLKFDTLASIEPFLLQIDAVPQLEEIRLSGNTLGVEACAGVGKLLATKQSLKVRRPSRFPLSPSSSTRFSAVKSKRAKIEISLSSLQIADFSDIFTGRLISEIPLSLTSLCTSLLHLPHLTTLDLSDNAFGGRSVEPMLSLLSTHTSLRVLKLNNNGLGPMGGATVAGALLENAERAKKEGRVASLRTIICGRNRLENGSAKAWADAFAALGGLVEVRLPQNGIRMEGIALLVAGLRSNSNLAILDLQDNTATLSGSKAIAASLPSWPKLTSLNLSDCLLKPRGGLAIAAILATGSNPLLTSLKLQSNELDARAVEVLARAIKDHLSGLVELELNGNRGESDDECYVKIVEALEGWGHAAALDELDEMEEAESDEEEEDDEEEVVAEESKEDKEEVDELSAALSKVL